jgi:hypothetical protein
MELTYESGTTVPMTILTGFLGAGKTTMLNRILTGDHGLRVGVLVNDFGSINIDAELVVGVEGDTISLANGCVCCEIRDDLIESVVALLARPKASSTSCSRPAASPTPLASSRPSTIPTCATGSGWTASLASWTPTRSSPTPSIPRCSS